MDRVERNIAKSFRSAKQDIDQVKKQLNDLAEKHNELRELVIKLKDRSKK